MSEIKNGDTVRLKSGGPLMTVAGIGKYGMGASDEKAKCTWFDKNEYREKDFHLHLLEIVNDVNETSSTIFVAR